MLENQRSTEVRQSYAELNELRTMFEQHMRQCTRPRQSTSSLQSYEQGRFEVLTFSGKPDDLPRFIDLFSHWAISQQSEAALTYNIPIVVASKESREELNDQYGREMVDPPLIVWSALNKAIEKNSSLSSMVMCTKSPFDAWTLLKSTFESGDSDIACDNFKQLPMTAGEFAREYVCRAKGLVVAVRYHGIARYSGG